METAQFLPLLDCVQDENDMKGGFSEGGDRFILPSIE